MDLATLAATSRDVGATRSRLKKQALLADCLRAAGPAEVGIVVDYLSGILPQGRIGLGPSILRALAGVPAATSAGLTLAEVDATFTDIAGVSGQGAQAKKRDLLGGLLARAIATEREFLGRLITGELRQGALEGVLIEAIAEAASVPADEVRRAVMLAGEGSGVAVAAMQEGRQGLERFRLELLHPVRPMLAQPAEDMGAAMAALGEAALDYKMDGARVQIHRLGDDVRIYSRRLNDVTASLPEVVEQTLSLPATSLILDGEVIALREDGRPRPFQQTMRRFGRKIDVDAMRDELPLSVFMFDCLHWDGDDLIDRPAAERFRCLADGVPEALNVPRIVTDDADRANAFLAGALERGHEGVMAKALASAYAAGNRGAEWLKVKQAHTLDLVVLGAEWGSGRRKGWLSNLHLGARVPEDGSFVMLGKTFKGLTDKVLTWQTERLQALEIGRDDYAIYVRPELVVEIAVNEIQASPHYPAGMALRFARVKRYRDDKQAADADTIDTVRALFARQGGHAA